jgi:hypothetical protein
MKYLIVILSLLLTGCYYDKEEELYGVVNCDTSNVNYSATITGILNNYGCTGCHSGNAPSGNIGLQDFTSVKNAAQSGKLLGAIQHNSGFSPMPKGGGKMSDCDINKIKAWIDAGLVNN